MESEYEDNLGTKYKPDSVENKQNQARTMNYQATDLTKTIFLVLSAPLM